MRAHRTALRKDIVKRRKVKEVRKRKMESQRAGKGREKREREGGTHETGKGKGVRKNKNGS